MFHTNLTCQSHAVANSGAKRTNREVYILRRFWIREKNQIRFWTCFWQTRQEPLGCGDIFGILNNNNLHFGWSIGHGSDLTQDAAWIWAPMWIKTKMYWSSVHVDGRLLRSSERWCLCRNWCGAFQPKRKARQVFLTKTDDGDDCKAEPWNQKDCCL